MIAALMRALLGEARRGGAGAKAGRPELPISTMTLRHQYREDGPCHIGVTVPVGPRGRVLSKKQYVDADGYDVWEFEAEIDPFV